MYPTYLPLIKKHLSGMAAKADVAAIIQHHRIQASPGYRAAANYVLRELRAVGLQAEIESYPANNETAFWAARSFQEWSATKGTLHLVGEDGALTEKLADYRDMKLSLIQRSIPFKGELEVVVVDQGTWAADYDGLDVKGKLVLTNGDVEHVRQLAVEKLEAVGILFDGMAAALPVRLPGDLQDERQYTSFWWTGLPGEVACFGFVLTPRQGSRLRQLCQQGTVRVKVDIEARLYDGEMEVVTAVIPGRGGDGNKSGGNEAVVLVSHLCHPQPSANDNGTGVAVNLEVARTLYRLIQQGKLPQPKRDIRFLWLPEMTGSHAYLAAHENELGRLIAGLNLDMVGADQEVTGSVLVLEQPPEAAASYVGSLVHYLREQLVLEATAYNQRDRYSLQRVATTAFSGGSDHYIFSDPTVGVPMPMLIQWPDRYYHTSADTLEKVSPKTLNITGSIAASFAYFVAAADEEAADWLLAQVTTDYQQKLVEMVQTVRTALASGKEADDLGWRRRQLGYWLARQEEVVAAVAALGGSDEAAVQAKEMATAMTAEAEQALAELGISSVPPMRDEWVERAERLVPIRQFRGPSRAARALAELPVREREAWRRLVDGRPWGAYTMTVLAEYWADGQRTVAEIIELVEMETGIRDGELIMLNFDLLRRQGMVVYGEGGEV
ncbi:MAG TPA: DUF4910 domain-containing protein [Anaerolineae bacterium]|nr:DUF4910 domain-containing protein [Anaerolineae bacterium]